MRLTVSRYPSAHIWDLDAQVVPCGFHVCIHSFISFLAEKLCSKLRVLEIEFDQDNQLAKEL